MGSSKKKRATDSTFDNNNRHNNKVKEHEIYLCRCEEITEDEIDKAISEGARTLKGIKKRVYAGMGLCQGRTCSKLITQKLAQKVPKEHILPDTQRPPVRALKIREIIGEKDS